MSDPLYINVDTGSPEYHAVELRRALAMFVMGGVAEAQGARQGVRPGHTPASLSGTTWTVHHLVATVFPALTITSGIYAVGHAEESGSLDPADAGSDRIDRIDLQIRDHDEDGSGFRDSRAVYTAGVPGSGVAPDQVANSLELATINVPQDGTGSPTLTVIAPYTVAPGGILPVRDAAELPAAGMYDGLGVWRQDDDALDIRADGAWARIGTATAHARHVSRSSSQSIPDSTVTRLGWNLVVKSDGDMLAMGGTGIEIVRAGWYALSTGVIWASDNTGLRQVRLEVNASREAGDQRNAANNSIVTCSKMMFLNAGDEITTWVEQTSGASLNVLGESRTFLSAILLHS